MVIFRPASLYIIQLILSKFSGFKFTKSSENNCRKISHSDHNMGAIQLKNEDLSFTLYKVWDSSTSSVIKSHYLLRIRASLSINFWCINIMLSWDINVISNIHKKKKKVKHMCVCRKGAGPPFSFFGISGPPFLKELKMTKKFNWLLKVCMGLSQEHNDIISSVIWENPKVNWVTHMNIFFSFIYTVLQMCMSHCW